MGKLFSNCLILFCLPFASQGIKAGLAYPDPPGGWTYTFNGDAAAFGTGAFDALDGTWNRSNGSSEWDGSRVGPVIDVTTNKPGGASAFTEGDPASPGSSVTYLRIQDTGNPSQYGFAAPSNRKLQFVHDMTAEGPTDTFLDDGFTITFRARIPTPSKTTNALDNLYPNGESGSGPQPYPAGGDGYLIADNANGLFNPRQAAVGKRGFSLVTSNDTLGGLNATPRANFQGLQVNGLNGTTPVNTIDFNEAPAQFLPLDPTEWNEFWIVAQKDNSGLGTHVLLVYTNGSASAQIFHVTAASSGGESGGGGPNHIEMGMSQTAQMGCADVDFLAYKFEAVFPPGAGGLPPEISNVSPLPPPPGNLFFPAANGVSFTASSFGSSTIPTAGVVLVLNGTNVSGSLNITGPNTNLTVTYKGLADNTIYTGRITVTDSGGQSATFPLQFDTFTEPSALIIEAEDYNYGSGQFTDNPAPGIYAGFTGMPEVDFHDVTPSTLGDYRTSDAVDTLLSTDTVRNATDFEVSSVEQGEWLNYTHTFPFLPSAANYSVYLRYASQVAQQVRLDLVTGDRTKPNQATSFLGTFPATNSGVAHTYARLIDAFGNPLTATLAGVQTLRLTAPEASVNLQLNYLVLVGVGNGTNPPVVGFASPGPNSTNLLPDAPIQIAIVNRDSFVAPASISFQFDGTDVTSAATITSTATGASITYQPPSALTLNSTHTNRLFFSDNNAARTFTNQWTFTVANLPVLAAAWATAPGSGLTNGFNVQIHWHNGGQDLLFPNNATRAEDQVGNLLKDADTGLPYVNDAAGPNGDGTYSETNVINYSNDGTDRGSFPGDQPFPYIDPGTPNHIAMVVTANLELSAGLHRFGVRRDDGFKLVAGPDFTRAGATLVLGDFEPGGESPTATTEFDFMVQTNGLYPFRLVFFQNSGPCDIEWYSIDRLTGVAALINNPTNSTSVKAYRARTAPITNLRIVNPQLTGGNITFSFATVAGHSYYIDYQDVITDTWQLQTGTGVSGDGTIKAFSTPTNAAATRFYRVRAQ